MKIFLAALEDTLLGRYKIIGDFIKANPKKIFVLASYYYIQNRYLSDAYIDLIPYLKDFLLDSGAYSFINSQKISIRWDEYIEKYAHFIIKAKVKNFFELDIDNIVGYDRVKIYRRKLERLVNMPVIPVWHRSRGNDEFLRLCDEYKYIAVGGIAIRAIKPSEYDIFSYLIKEAHKRNCKIHGLGFTQCRLLNKYHFDSVDSSTWKIQAAFGTVNKFQEGKIIADRHREGRRVIDTLGIRLFNFKEWVKFQQYAERKL